MPQYTVYLEHGDADLAVRHLVCEAPNLRKALEKITAGGRSPGEYSVLAGPYGEHLADLTCDQFGNWSAEVLVCRSFDPNLAYATSHWLTYGFNGLGEPIPLNQGHYRDEPQAQNEDERRLRDASARG